MNITMRFSGAVMGAVCLMWGAAAWAQAAAASAPQASTSQSVATNKTVADAQKPPQQLQDTLLEVMKNAKQLGYKGRYKKLDPVVRKAFDFPFITRVVMGPDASKLDAQQTQKLEQALAKLSVTSYAKEFNDYSGQKFVYAKTRSIGGGKMVRYVFHSGSDRIHFDYQMHRDKKGQWKIANVIVDGVSDLALKSGQYRKLYSEKGFHGLLGWINKQIAGNEKAG